MEIFVLDSNFVRVSILDTFESLIWTERYYGYGDFEIYSTANIQNLSIPIGYYLQDRDTHYTMVIEDREVTTDSDAGFHVRLAGRSLASILDRRVIWPQTVLTGSFQGAIQTLLNNNIISPVTATRQIPNFVFIPSTDPSITSLTINAQFTGEYLYDAIVSLCQENKIGFLVTHDDTNITFQLYRGLDRSYAQTIIPYVIFSPNFENIINSNYLESDKVYKTDAIIAGEDQGASRKSATLGPNTAGIDRKELFVDARDVSSDTDDGVLTASEYQNLLLQRGAEKLAENTHIQIFEGNVEATRLFVFNEDFYLGDVVQIINEYGIEATSRVAEVVRTQTLDEIGIIPSFTAP